VAEANQTCFAVLDYGSEPQVADTEQINRWLVMTRSFWREWNLFNYYGGAYEKLSHVNSGTSVDPEELPWPKSQGRVMRHPLLHLQGDPRGEIIHYGGLVLAQQFVRRFQVAQRLDNALGLFGRWAAPLKLRRLFKII